MTNLGIGQQRNVERSEFDRFISQFSEGQLKLNPGDPAAQDRFKSFLEQSKQQFEVATAQPSPIDNSGGLLDALGGLATGETQRGLAGRALRATGGAIAGGAADAAGSIFDQLTGPFRTESSQQALGDLAQSDLVRGAVEAAEIYDAIGSLAVTEAVAPIASSRGPLGQIGENAPFGLSAIERNQFDAFLARMAEENATDRPLQESLRLLPGRAALEELNTPTRMAGSAAGDLLNFTPIPGVGFAAGRAADVAEEAARATPRIARTFADDAAHGATQIGRTATEAVDAAGRAAQGATDRLRPISDVAASVGDEFPSDAIQRQIDDVEDLLVARFGEAELTKAEIPALGPSTIPTDDPELIRLNQLFEQRDALIETERQGGISDAISSLGAVARGGPVSSEEVARILGDLESSAFLRQASRSQTTQSADDLADTIFKRLINAQRNNLHFYTADTRAEATAKFAEGAFGRSPARTIDQANAIAADLLRGDAATPPAAALPQPPQATDRLRPISDVAASTVDPEGVGAISRRTDPLFLDPRDATFAEVDEAVSRAGRSEFDLAVEAFGSEEEAKRFFILDRRANGSSLLGDPRRADEASEELGRMTENFTDEQERLLYGNINDPDIPEESLKELRRTLDLVSVADAEDVPLVTLAITRRLSRLTPEKLQTVLGASRGEAAGRLFNDSMNVVAVREGVKNLNAIGLTNDQIFEGVVRQLQSEGVEAADIDVLIGPFLRGEASPPPAAAISPPQAALQPPAARVAGEVADAGLDAAPPISVGPAASEPPPLVAPFEGRRQPAVQSALGEGFGQSERTIVPFPIKQADVPFTDLTPIGKPGVLLEVSPPEIGDTLLGLRPLPFKVSDVPELGRFDRATNVARGALMRRTGKELILKNKVVNTAMKETQRVQPTIRSQSARTTALVSSPYRVLKADKQGRIPHLAGKDPLIKGGGAPSIQDVAARRPRFLAALTDSEKEALEKIRLALEPYATAREEVGLDLSGRLDLIAGATPEESGFYLPRGGNPGSPDIPRSSRKSGGKTSSELRAEYASMSEAMDDGAVYAPFGDAIRSFTQDMGERIANLHMGNFLERIEVETGIPLGRPGGKKLVGEASLPNGFSVPNLRELRDTSFPPEITNGINEILARQGSLVGKGAPIIKAINAYNNFYVAAGASMDNSAIAIQGIVAAADDPRTSAKSLLLNGELWGTGRAEEIFGRYIRNFDEKAVEMKMLDSSDWAQDGLIFNGNETEVTQSFVTKIPGIRRSANAFGLYGDSLRPGLAHDDLFMEMHRTGKTAQELRADGSTEQIARAANSATGVTAGSEITDMASFFAFAPRFFQSRLETAVRGVRGLDIDAPLDLLPNAARRRLPQSKLNPAARLQDRISRRRMVRLFGYGTAITVAANASQGQLTDFDPFKNGRLNPNFMRIRFGDRDYSIFGTWDSLLRLIIGTASGTKQGDVGQILRNFRGLGSGVVSQGWDLISGQDFQGNITGLKQLDPLAFVTHLFRSNIPFSARELPDIAGEIAGGVAEGDAGTIVEGGVRLAAEIHGAKSSPLSASDLIALIEDPNTPPDEKAELEQELYRRNQSRLKNDFAGQSDKDLENEMGKLLAEQKRRKSTPRKEEAQETRGILERAEKYRQEQLAR